MATIQIRFFGTFSISNGDYIISEDENRSKKLWKLLQYIVVNRTRRIPQEELVALIWDGPDAGENPMSSLKTMLHRIRTSLERLELMDPRKIIMQKGGTYFWNNMLDYTTDADEFDALMHQISDEESEERVLEYALQALSLYRGYFLNGKYSDCAWAAEPAKRYHEAYIRTFETAASILASQRRYDELITISERAIAIDNSQEPFHYYLLRALVEKGETLKAMKMYEQVIDLFYNKIRQNPSERLRLLYRSISKVTNGVELDIGLIRDKLSGRTDEDKPDFVEYDTFRYLYTAAKVSGRRTSSPYYLLLLTVHATGTSYALPSTKHQDRAVSMLREMLGDYLSQGDFCTRYSVSQFLCVAHFESEDAAKQIADRMTKEFKSANLAVHIELNVKVAIAD